MNLLLGLARVYLPAAFARRRLNRLVAATADAFQRPAPDISGLSYRESLVAFAVFSGDCAEACLSLPEGQHEVRRRLFDAAQAIGQELRRSLRVTTGQQVASALRIAYQALGIAFEGTSYGEVVIPRCLFSSYYSGPVCRVMEALDQGLACGLSGGARLTFFCRITEGSPVCRAVLEPPPAL
ncbi:MAG: hypothetical protein JSU73_01575 [candidate division WOR-3 bacterium]|nr:MAG: hypothetical protein JSU73_01575 [candidate division WOR-3 bacterium]